MKYLLLVYNNALNREALPASEHMAYSQACQANDEALRLSGYLLAAALLQGSDTAATVHVRNGRLSLSGGLSSTSKKRLVALYFINARDLNEAVRVASTMPQACRGPIEVRSVLEFNQLDVRD